MSEIVTVRDLAMVTSDIQYAQRQGARQLASNLIEIGRLLVEAKTMVEPKTGTSTSGTTSATPHLQLITG